MKRTLVILVALIMCLSSFAGQKYTSFIVKGDIFVLEDGKNRQMKCGEVLDESVVVEITPGAYLTLKSSDKKHHTLTVNKPFKGTIKQMKKIKGAKVKRTRAFMNVVNGKTAEDFVIEGNRTMSAGGYNTRDILMSKDERMALEALHSILKEADLIDQ